MLKSRKEICGLSSGYTVVRIWHIYARTYNFGDHALGIGVRRLLKEAFKEYGVEVIFEVLDTHRLYINSNDINNLNIHGDLVVVGGGGLVHCWDGVHWMFHLPTRLLRKLRIPLWVFGVGYNQLPSQGCLPRYVKKNIRRVIGKTISFSVRNDGSKEKMLCEGFSADEIPDPGFFLDDTYPCLRDRKYAIVQIAGDSLKSRMGDLDEWIKSIAACVDWICREDIHVVFIPHCELDVVVTKEVVKQLSVDDYEVLDFWDCVLDENCYKLLALYKHAELVVGSRGHAQIISYGMRTPFATLSTHYKQLELARRLNLFDYATDKPEEFMQVVQSAYRDKVKIKAIEDEGMSILNRKMKDYLGRIVPNVVKAKQTYRQSWIDYKFVQLRDLMDYRF